VSRRQLDTVLQRVRSIAGRRPPAAGTDPELLERFAAARDEDAFAALVARHYPMVLGVCRRVLNHAQDAEDACQATFLALARQAAAVRRREALAGWLYHVARRIALKVRTTAARRAARAGEATTAPAVETAPDVTWREALGVLDEELARMPAAYRSALVLCYLEGKTQDEAARQLGWSLGRSAASWSAVATSQTPTPCGLCSARASRLPSRLNTGSDANPWILTNSRAVFVSTSHRWSWCFCRPS
jgi:RNA polymerase sigma factor (sigma-70 family)